MATFTKGARAIKQAANENPATWGLELNTDALDMFDDAIFGHVEVEIGDRNHALTTNNGAADEGRMPLITVTSSGNLTAARDITIPGNPCVKVIRNATSGDQAINVGRGGSFVRIENGDTKQIWYDGTTTRILDVLDLSVISIDDEIIFQTPVGTELFRFKQNGEWNISDADHNIAYNTTLSIRRAGATPDDDPTATYIMRFDNNNRILFGKQDSGTGDEGIELIPPTASQGADAASGKGWQLIIQGDQADDYTRLSPGEIEIPGLISFRDGVVPRITGNLIVDGVLRSEGGIGIFTGAPRTNDVLETMVSFAAADGRAMGGIQASINAGPDFFDPSDKRLKTDIEDLTQAESRIADLNPVRYRMKGDDRPCSTRIAGFIAQDVAKVIPEAVSEHSGILGLSWKRFIPYIVGAIKSILKRQGEQAKRIKELEDRLDALDKG